MDRTQCCLSLSVQPSRGLMDEKFIVLIQNGPPGFKLTVHAFHQSEDGHKWEAFGHYTADATGTVNVSEDLSLGGTYSGVEPMGLLWSLIPVPGSKPGLRMRRLNIQIPMEVTISVYQGHQTEGFVDQVSLASVLVERWYMAPGVRRIPITEGGLTAMLFLPPGPGPFPGVLDLWGGGGKLVEYRSALLASHGFASLALDYLTNKITIETGKLVDNKYFECRILVVSSDTGGQLLSNHHQVVVVPKNLDFVELLKPTLPFWMRQSLKTWEVLPISWQQTAYSILQQHPQVLGSRIAMVGLSLGCAITFKMAVYSDVFKLSCAVCISGSHVQPVDGSLEQMMSFFQENAQKIRVTEENHAIMRDLLLPIPADSSFKVDVGQLQCPLLLVVGEDDQNWPAHESAMDIKEMMERAGNSHLLTVLSYPNTGHLIEPPYTAHARASNFISASSGEKFIALWGGEKVAHSYAQEDAWRKMLLFLRENLYAGRNPVLPPSSHL